MVDNTKSNREVIRLLLLALIGAILVVLMLRFEKLSGVYYVSDTDLPSVSNITFSRVQDDTYRAKYWGFIPAGEIEVVKAHRPEVMVRPACVLVAGDGEDLRIEAFTYPNSVAELAGLRVNDIIVSANEVHISSFESLKSVLVASDGYLTLGIMRDASYLTLQIDLGESKTLGISVSTFEPVLGTLSFIDEFGYYYALGHDTEGVNLGLSSVLLATGGERDGEMILTNALSSEVGVVSDPSGNGIVGIAPYDWVSGESYDLAWAWEIEDGEGTVLISQLDGTFKEVAVEIDDNPVSVNSSDTKSYRMESDDFTFLKGMSGSPVIQNNRVIGVLTSVRVSDQSIGYFIPADTVVMRGNLV